MKEHSIIKGLTPVHTLIKNFKLTKIPRAERIEDQSCSGCFWKTWEILVGVCCLTLSQTKNVIFHILFSDLASKIEAGFQT